MRSARWALVAVCAVASLVVAPAGASSPRVAETATTSITLRVVGCDTCRVEAVQNVAGALTWRSSEQRVRHGQVELTVPTDRTEQMAFLVYAPYDEVVRAGFALAAVTSYRHADAGDPVRARYARGTHPASACWTGTEQSAVEDTLVVGRRRQRAPLIAPGRLTVASAYLRNALPSSPYWVRVPGASYHLSDPSICA